MSLKNRITLPVRVPAHKARKVILKSRIENYIGVLRGEYSESKKVYPWICGTVDFNSLYPEKTYSGSGSMKLSPVLFFTFSLFTFLSSITTYSMLDKIIYGGL
jgi:hypothetical protein